MKYAILIAIVCLSCAGPRPIEKREHIEDLNGCAAACDNLGKMQCDGWEGSPGPDEVYGTPDDVGCAQACRDIVGATSITLNTVCISRSRSCTQAALCFD